MMKKFIFKIKSKKKGLLIIIFFKSLIRGLNIKIVALNIDKWVNHFFFFLNVRRRKINR